MIFKFLFILHATINTNIKLIWNFLCMHMQHDINYTLCTSFLWIDVISQARQKNQQNTNNKQTNQSTYLKCPKWWLSIPSKITNWTFNQKMETRTWGGIAFIVRDYMYCHCKRTFQFKWHIHIQLFVLLIWKVNSAHFPLNYEKNLNVIKYDKAAAMKYIRIMIKVFQITLNW